MINEELDRVPGGGGGGGGHSGELHDCFCCNIR